MKKILMLILLAAGMKAGAQTHRLLKIWETDTVIAIPESVLPDPAKHILYVSLIDGGGWDADGKGGVAKMDDQGKNYDPGWITGLNAPKGLGRYKDRMYVADINEVVVISVKEGRIEKKIAIDSANGLNDITVDSRGTVYVSDSRRAKIWRIEQDIPALYLDDIKGANGLKALSSGLVFAQGKLLQEAGKDKKIRTIAELPGGIDGIEPVGKGDFIVTVWQGYIYYVTFAGKVQLLLDTHEAGKNTADIGFDPAKKIVYVPSFNGKTVAAYRLQ